ncbi:ATP-binding cassette domain-containing protein [Roseisolibacter sp. H3M3-2]|uniref:ATP-binding cassette domain-containing protein n=1 Tax=Roseisolibacter sp. H3M3-2 TaxID=3031323 RepID=UPI0023DC322C|nr:ATP-binding cassette domain-containing protein [Roseisolibacter sp. H3M3-2]MDF1506105.1 ATP-binding cassette domain-containing protein [Roseisolibacter sp. H3M3-2]
MSAAAEPAEPMVRLRGVRVAYVRGGPPALVCDALDVAAGVTLVVGPNGAGKSTLLRVVAGVERPGAGTVELLGRDAACDKAAARRALAYVPEHPELSPYATVGEVARLVARLRGAGDAAADAPLDAAGLGELAARTVRELSLGQRRPALLAAACVAEPRVDLLDQPLEAMDRATRARVVDWVARLRADGAAVLLATHDVAPFAPHADRAMVDAGGAARWAPPLPDAADARVATLEALASDGAG